MSKLCALCGASALAMEIALMAPFNWAYAQSSDNTLPSVTVQAPPNPKRAANPDEANGPHSGFATGQTTSGAGGTDGQRGDGSHKRHA